MEYRIGGKEELSVSMCTGVEKFFEISVIRRTTMNKQWASYLQYLRDWASTHTDTGCFGMSPVCFDEWLCNEGTLNEEDRLPECDSEYCIFNPNGYCFYPLVYSKQPELSEDNCKSSIYRE